MSPHQARTSTPAHTFFQISAAGFAGRARCAVFYRAEHIHPAPAPADVRALRRRGTTSPVRPLPTRLKSILHVADWSILRDVGFATTLLLVCAIGARWSSDPSVISRGAQNGTGSQLACGWEWFDQVCWLLRMSFNRVLISRNEWAPPPRDCVFGQATLYDLQYYCVRAPNYDFLILGS